MNNKTKAAFFFMASMLAFLGIMVMNTTQNQIMAATICIIEYQCAIETAKGG